MYNAVHYMYNTVRFIYNAVHYIVSSAVSAIFLRAVINFP